MLAGVGRLGCGDGRTRQRPCHVCCRRQVDGFADKWGQQRSKELSQLVDIPAQPGRACSTLTQLPGLTLSLLPSKFTITLRS